MPVTLTLHCPSCTSDQLIKYGITPNGKQRYRCRGCGRQHRADPAPNGYPPEQREVILRAYQERSSLRGLSRTFGVSRSTVSGWIKKSPDAAAAGYDTAARPSRRGTGTR